MKKTILFIFTIILVATMMLAFVGCSSATVQDQLRAIWQHYEKYVYTVVGNDETGTYTVEIEPNNNSTVTIGDITLEDVKTGYIIKSVLEIGSLTQETACYVQKTSGSSLLVPIASYTKKVGDEYTDVISGKYEDKKFNYTITEYGAPRSESISLSTPYYDNNQIHQLLRAVNSLGSGLNFSFNVAVPTENAVASLTASCNNTEDITWGDKTTTCNVVQLKRQTQVTGAYHVLYYAKDPITVNTWELKNVLVCFKEPLGGDNFMVYTLTSISFTKD